MSKKTKKYKCTRCAMKVAESELRDYRYCPHCGNYIIKY